ncbi:type IV pilus modification protein PilV [Variovorax sp. KBW07]|uniref:type IV pilus modification protein PilV n=1 Tax=Variovorax sp. KBW07 TaxID=2153358 RepID=UPI000F585EB1|nr:type IV pilus modification protein PilV [Variovorax sp. KBW07]RQO62903.1 type IV pilus modification protein PilV [Variovorax sp. KBW07]
MNMKTHNTQRGATLIEVLVAIVILAVALFGMAGLTSSAVKYNQFSRMRATGLSLVADYTERARANVSGFANYAYTDAYNASSRSAATSDPTEAPATCQVDTSNPTAPINTCGAAIANYDKSQWLTNVANRLPGGTAYVTADLTPAPPGVNGLPATRVLNIWLIWTAIEEAGGFFQQQQPCPTGANIAAGTSVNCMYFRITL